MSSLQTQQAVEARDTSRVVALAILAIVLSGSALWLVTSGRLTSAISGIGYFHLREIRVDTQWPLSEEQVKRWLPRLEGKSLLTLDPQAIIDGLSSKTWVDSVTLKKAYPARLELAVTARRARAIVVKGGYSHFVDANGTNIEKTTPLLLRALDLPVISVEKGADIAQWSVPAIMEVLERFSKGLDSQYAVSQLVLGAHPFFKVFLNHPSVEVSLHLHNYERQLPILALLLHSPPGQIGQPQRINLVLPKKAVVSSRLSN